MTTEVPITLSPPKTGTKSLIIRNDLDKDPLNPRKKSWTSWLFESIFVKILFNPTSLIFIH